MTVFVATLGSDTGTRKHVQRIIEEGEWDKSVLITTKDAQTGFTCAKDITWVIVDTELFLTPLKEHIKKAITGSIGFGDVAVNFVSGGGKIHMATLGALLELGAGIRLIALTPEGVREI